MERMIKRRFLMVMAAILLITMAAQSQVVYGDKAGWSVYTTEDEFTGKRSHYLRYFDQQRRLAASFFPGPNRLAVLEWYDGRLYFDVTFDAVMDHRGHIAEEQIDYELRVTLPKNESSEDFGEATLKFGDVEQAGETFFGTFVFNVDCDDMKQGSTVAVRWQDPIRGRQTVRKISLTGFTRCYDECLRRYGVKK